MKEELFIFTREEIYERDKLLLEFYSNLNKDGIYPTFPEPVILPDEDEIEKEANNLPFIEWRGIFKAGANLILSKLKGK